MASSTTGITGKLETIAALVEMKSSADNVYGYIKSSKHYSIPKAAYTHELGVGSVHDVADGDTSGSTKVQTYTGSKHYSFPKAAYTHELGVGSVLDVADWDTSGSTKVQTYKSTHSSLPKVAYINGREVVAVQGEDDYDTSEVHGEEEVHSEEDWDTSGSTKLQTYTIDGTVETIKKKVEIDDVNKIVSLTAVDGHVPEQFKSYKVNFQVIPKTGEGANNMVKITLEFEKLNESDQPPNKYLSFLVNFIKDIDAHLIAS